MSAYKLPVCPRPSVWLFHWKRNAPQRRSVLQLHRRRSPQPLLFPSRSLRRELLLSEGAQPDAACWNPSAHGSHRHFPGTESAPLPRKIPFSGKRPCNQTWFSHIPAFLPGSGRKRNSLQNARLRPGLHSPAPHGNCLPRPPSYKQPGPLPVDSLGQTYLFYGMALPQSHNR